MAFAGPALRLLLVVLLGSAGLSGVGCGSPEVTELRILTDLAEAEVRDLTKDFATWRDGRPKSVSSSARLRWIRLTRPLDPDFQTNAKPWIDMILTVSPGFADPHPPGLVDRTGTIPRTETTATGTLWRFPYSSLVLLVNSDAFESRAVPLTSSWSGLDDPRLDGFIALDDPRRDPLTLAMAQAWLEAGTWSDGYAALVRSAGRALPFGRNPGNAEAIVRRGGAALAPAASGTSREGTVREVPLDVPLTLFAELVPGESPAESGVEFLRFLSERYGRTPNADQPPMKTRLVAELLGSTLVDAQSELDGAMDVLSRVDAHRLESFLVQAPPWPPASVLELSGTDPGGALLESLAAELTTGLDARTWLLNSWERTPRPIDGHCLDELVNAVDGKLVREPRFLRWLSTEWTAWAKQRYRRVARQARLDQGDATPVVSPGAQP